MAVGISSDGDYIHRASIPSGTAGTLTAGAFADFFFGVWCYFPSAGNSHGATANGSVFNGVSAAREIRLGKDSQGATYDGPQTIIVWESGTPDESSFSAEPPFDTWVYIYFTADATDETAGWRSLGSDTWTTATFANNNAGSQYINDLYVGSTATSQALFGHYAYARAVGAVKTTSEALAYSKSSVTETGDWGFWPLADNTDTGDDSGNGYDFTFGGTLTSETSPTLDAGPSITSVSGDDVIGATETNWVIAGSGFGAA